MSETRNERIRNLLECATWPLQAASEVVHEAPQDANEVAIGDFLHELAYWLKEVRELFRVDGTESVYGYNGVVLELESQVESLACAVFPDRERANRTNAHVEEEDDAT